MKDQNLFLIRNGVATLQNSRILDSVRTLFFKKKEKFKKKVNNKDILVI